MNRYTVKEILRVISETRKGDTLQIQGLSQAQYNIAARYCEQSKITKNAQYVANQDMYYNFLRDLSRTI